VQNELALVDEWRGRYIPDPDGPLYEQFTLAETLCILIGPALPISVQVAMARAARTIFQNLMEHGQA
jgi:hypothetical protein